MSGSRGVVVHVTSLAVTVRTLLHAQLCALVDDGWDVVVVTSPDGTRQPAAPYRRLHEHLPRTLSPFEDWRIDRRLRRLFRELDPTIVHTHSVKVALPALMAAGAARVPRRLHTVHGFYHLKTVRPLERRLARWWEARVLRLADAAAFVSRAELDYARERFGGHGEYSWLGNGVDLERFRPPTAEERRAARRELGIPAEAQVISTLTRFGHENRLDRLTAVFGALAAKRDDVHLIIAGGALPGDRHARPLDLSGCPADRVHRPGWVPDVRPVLHASDLFLLLSQGEGRSTAAMEAAATGLPLVLTDMPASRELVDDGVSGYLVDADDPGSAFGAVRRLLEDPDLREGQRRCSRAVAEARFDQGDVDRRLTQFYARLGRADADRRV
jgi:glycosyltransferase involved in cell wall biosynthesis